MKRWRCNLVFLVCFVLYIDVLSAPMRLSAGFRIYIYIYMSRCRIICFDVFLNKSFSEMKRMQDHFFNLLIRHWDLSHRVERQKLMLIYQQAGRKCLCVSRRVVLWLTFAYVRNAVPMFYWNFVIIYIFPKVSCLNICSGIDWRVFKKTYGRFPRGVQKEATI